MSLENSIWRQYHKTLTIHDVLVRLYGCDAQQIQEDENALYAILKRRLTKKELRCFIMSEVGRDVAEIMDTLDVTSELFETLKRKAYRKVLQSEMRNSVTFSQKITEL
jgi:DNA-binding CsgD family transcriptional regulator